jgi:DNA-binding CsgD family transcriptional regulator
MGSAPRTFSLHFRDATAGALEVSLQKSGALVIVTIEQAGPPRASVVQTAQRYELTPAEADVLALAARGLRNRQIALRLGVQLPTVKTHLSRAYAKMSVATRVQATLAARRLG